MMRIQSLLVLGMLVCTGRFALAADTDAPKAKSGAKESSKSSRQAKVFVSKKGGFSAVFPCDPEEFTQSQKSPLGEVELWMTVARGGADNELEYAVSVNTLPQELPAELNDLVFPMIRDMAVTQSGAKLVSDRKITVGQSQGLEMILDEKGGNKRLVWMLLKKNQLYQVTASGPVKSIPISFREFADSFRFVDGPAPAKAKPAKSKSKSGSPTLPKSLNPSRSAPKLP